MFWRKILKIFVYVSACLLLLEVAAGVLLSTGYGAKLILETNCDKAWYWRWRNRHPTDPLRIYYKFDIFDASRGWALKPGLDAVPAFKGKTVSSNSKGIRGKIEYTHGRSDQKRILILGDSFTFGDDVSDDETYSDYLKQAFPSFEIINFGVHGYGHDQMLIYFKEEGIQYEPDIVILGFVGADMKRNLLSFRDYSKPKFSLRNKKLRLENSPVVAPRKLIEQRKYESKLAALLNLFYYKAKKKLGLSKAESEKITTALLDEIVKTSRRVDAIPIFVFLPINKELLSDKKLLPAEQYLLEYCEQRSLHCFSSRPYFIARRRKGENIETAGHYGPKEHRIVAEAIEKYLRNNEEDLFAQGDFSRTGASSSRRSVPAH